MLTVLLLSLVLGLAWANGANDVAKGVATLAGSGVAGARRAILWGTATTVAGGFAAILWGGALVTLFGKGFLTANPQHAFGFAAAAIGAAAGWVLLATRLRLPVSTTHALIGGIVGAALGVMGVGAVAYDAVGEKALLPLLTSPLVAIGVCWVLLLGTRLIEKHLPAWSPGCCDPADYEKDPFVCAPKSGAPSEVVRKVWTSLHWLSSGLVGFARGLNDVPKMAALAVPTIAALPILGVARSTAPSAAAIAIGATALAMGLGSLWGGFRLLPVLAQRVTRMDVRTGLAANVGTSALVLFASPLGLPVSTTHVATGALMGVRFGEKKTPRAGDALRAILIGWVITLPCAALLGFLCARLAVLGGL